MDKPQRRAKSGRSPEREGRAYSKIDAVHNNNAVQEIDDSHLAQETRVVEETRDVEVEYYTEAFKCHETRVVQSLDETRVVEETRGVKQEYFTGGVITEHEAEQISKCEATAKSSEGVADQGTECEAITRSAEGDADQNSKWAPTRKAQKSIENAQEDTKKISQCVTTAKSRIKSAKPEYDPHAKWIWNVTRAYAQWRAYEDEPSGGFASTAPAFEITGEINMGKVEPSITLAVGVGVL
jgi:hypothetical protein